MGKRENPENEVESGKVEKPVPSTRKSTKKVSKKVSKKTPKGVSKKCKPVKDPLKDLAKVMQLIEEDTKLRDYKQTIRAISAKLYEHLSCFIIIGYTEDGSPVNITAATTPRDYDALSTGLQKYVLDILPPGPPGSHH